MRHRASPWPRMLAGFLPRPLARAAATPSLANPGTPGISELDAASSPGTVPPGRLRVLGTGERAFPAIVERIAAAEHSIEIRAFLWRDDDAGNTLGRAILSAAERGVKVTIHKDRIAAVYEYTGG